jgi:DNA-binding CsgD family transcriptional regulator
MAKLTSTDLRGVLELLFDLGSQPSADPFPLPVLDRLCTLLGARTAGYGEFSITDNGQSYAAQRRLSNQTEPAWRAEIVRRWWLQDPIVCCVHSRAVEPLAVSDRVSIRTFQRLEYFQYVHHPFGTADCVRLFLPAPQATSRFFWFDQQHWGLKQRERELLELLRPHLVLWRSRWNAPAGPAVFELSAREQEVLRAVANGATNREIAEQLWISPHTVRTHLQHIFQQLNVHTRTEAAALLRNLGPEPDTFPDAAEEISKPEPPIRA